MTGQGDAAVPLPADATEEVAAVRQLREMLRTPARYVERRTDELGELSSACVYWTTRVQVRMPPTQNQVGRPSLITLGIFEKKRHPDLTARDGAGVELPLLRRRDCTRALVALLMQDLVDAVTLSDTDLEQLAVLAAEVVSRTPSEASPFYEQYVAKARAVASTYPAIDAHLKFLGQFVHFTHVLAYVPYTAGDVSILTYRYSEKNSFPRLPGGNIRNNGFWTVLRHVGRLSGLLAIPFDLKLSGANHAHSYYLLVTTPQGTEVEALYWKEMVAQPGVRDVGGSYIHESRHDVLACYHPERDAKGGLARVEIRLHGSALRLLWLLNAAIVVMALYVARTTHEVVRNAQLHESLPLLAGIPAALLAFITQSKNEMTARIGAWVGRAYLALAVATAALGLALSGDIFKTSRGIQNSVLNDRHLAAVGAAFGTFLLVLLTYVCFRPPGPAKRATDSGIPPTYAEMRTYVQRRRRNSLMCVVIASLLAGAAFAFGIG